MPDIAIRNALAKYGNSAEDIKALLGEVAPELERLRSEEERVLNVPEFLTADEVKSYFNVDIEEGWKVRLTPDSEGGYSVAQITPDGVQINEDQSLIMPDGTAYTREQLDAMDMAAMPLNAQRYYWDEVSQQYVEATPEDIAAIADMEAQTGVAGPQLINHAQYIERQQEQYQKIQDAFGTVFPDVSLEDMSRLAYENTDEFLKALLAAGRNEQTELVISTMFPEATPEQINELFTTGNEKYYWDTGTQQYVEATTEDLELIAEQEAISGPSGKPVLNNAQYTAWIQEENARRQKVHNTLQNLFPDVAVEDFNTWAGNNRDEVLRRLQETGRTPDTEAFLRAYANGITDEVVNAFFESKPADEDVSYSDFQKDYFKEKGWKYYGDNRATGFQQGLDMLPLSYQERADIQSHYAEVGDAYKVEYGDPDEGKYGIADIIGLQESILGAVLYGIQSLVPGASETEKMVWAGREEGAGALANYREAWIETAPDYGVDTAIGRIGTRGLIELGADITNFIPGIGFVKYGAKTAAKAAVKEATEAAAREVSESVAAATVKAGIKNKTIADAVDSLRVAISSQDVDAIRVATKTLDDISQQSPDAGLRDVLLKQIDTISNNADALVNAKSAPDVLKAVKEMTPVSAKKTGPVTTDVISSAQELIDRARAKVLSGIKGKIAGLPVINRIGRFANNLAFAGDVPAILKAVSGKIDDQINGGVILLLSRTRRLMAESSKHFDIDDIGNVLSKDIKQIKALPNGVQSRSFHDMIEYAPWYDFGTGIVGDARRELIDAFREASNNISGMLRREGILIDTGTALPGQIKARTGETGWAFLHRVVSELKEQAADILARDIEIASPDFARFAKESAYGYAARFAEAVASGAVKASPDVNILLDNFANIADVAVKKNTLNAKRSWATVAEGMKSGVTYEANPFKELAQQVNYSYDLVKRKRMAETIIELVKTTTPIEATNKELGIDYMQMVADNKGIKKAVDYIHRAARGESLPGGAMNAIRKDFPELATKLDEALKILPKQRTKLINQVIRDITAATKLTATDAVAIGKRSKLLADIKLAFKPFGTKADVTVNDIATVVKKTIKDKDVAAKTVKAIYAGMNADQKLALKSILDEAKGLAAQSASALRKATVVKNKYADRMSSYGTEEYGKVIGAPGLGNRVIVEQGGKTGQAFADEIRNAFGYMPGDYDDAIKAVGEVGAAMRMLRLGFDLSTYTIQQALTFGYDIANLVTLKPTGVWAKSAAGAIRTVTSKDMTHLSSFLEQHADIVADYIRRGGLVETAEYTEGAAPIERLFAKLPGKAGEVGQFINKHVLGRSDDVFTTARVESAVNLYEAGYKSAERAGALDEWAEMCNKLTGVLSTRGMGIPKWQRAVESAFIFMAPRFTRANIAIIYDIVTNPTSYTSKQAAKSLAALIAMNQALYVGINKAQGKDVNLNPFDRNWGKIEIGNYTYRMDGIMSDIRRLLASIDATTYAMTGDNVSLSGKDDNTMTLDRLGFQQFQSKTSPVTGTGLNIIEMMLNKQARNWEGEPLTWGNIFGSWLTPSWTDPLLSDKSPDRFMASAGEFIGLSALEVDKPYELQYTWAKDFEAYNDIPSNDIERKTLLNAATTSEEKALYELSRAEYRKKNPKVDAQLFVSGQVDTVSTIEAANFALTLIREQGLDIESIGGIVTNRDDTAAKAAAGINDTWTPTDALVKALDEDAETVPYPSTFHEQNKMAHDVYADAYRLRDLYADEKSSVYIKDLADRAAMYRTIDDNTPGFADMRARLEMLNLADNDDVLASVGAPSEAIIDKYVWHAQIVADYGGSSAEARLDLLENPDLHQWGQARETFNWSRLEDESIDALRLQVKNRDLNEQYAAYSDDEIYSDEEEAERKQFKIDNPEWWDDMQRIEAYKKGADKTIAEAWVNRQDTVDKYGSGSAEAKLWLIDHPDVWKWATSKDVGLLESDGSDWKEKSLRISAEYRELDTEYNDLGDKSKDTYIDDDDDRAKAREALLVANPEYNDARRRRDVYGYNGTDDIANMYVEYGKVVDKYGAGSAEAKLFRIDNPVLQQWAADEDTFKWADVTEQNEGVLRINAEWREEDKSYDSIKDADASLQAQLRKQYLADNEDYARVRYERDARRLELEESQVAKYIEYNMLPDYGYHKLRYRNDNPDFDAAMKAANPDKPWTDLEPGKIPDKRYDDIYEEYKGLFDQYENVQGTETARQKKRDGIFESNPDFKSAYYERKAYGDFFDEKYVKNYVEYYLLDDAGFANERYLKEHQDFYQQLRAKHELKEDWSNVEQGKTLSYFDTIPSEEVERLYTIYQKLPTSDKQREVYRKEHPSLDEWLVNIKGLKPLGHVHVKKTATKTIEDFEKSFLDSLDIINKR